MVYQLYRGYVTKASLDTVLVPDVLGEPRSERSARTGIEVFSTLFYTSSGVNPDFLQRNATTRGT